MRRTRRRWKWVMVALGVLLLAHGARVAPRVQKGGWGAAVPGVVLVAWMPLMSEEPGTGLEGMTFGIVVGSGPGLPQASGMDRLVMKEVGGESYLRSIFRDVPAPSRLGWVSRRLLFLLARTEEIGVMTDSTTAKGHAYKHAVSAVLNADKALAGEARWAHGVAYIETEPDRAYGLGELVRGDFRIRRLVLGGYTLSGSLGGEIVEYRCGTPSGMMTMGSGFMPMGTPQEIAAHWIGRYSWDWVHEADRARGRTHSVERHPFGLAEPDGAGGGVVRLRYGVMMNEAPWGETQRMRTLGSLERSIPVQIEESRTMTADQSPASRAMLESRLRAELVVEFDSTRKAWVPLVKLRWAGERPDGETILFGGMVSVCFEMEGSPVGQGQVLLGSGHGQSWWFVGPAEPHRGRSDLVVRANQNKRLAGEVEPSNFFPGASNRSGRLVVRIMPVQGNSPQAHGGLWADRVYDGELVLRLDRWTIDEVRRYVVNGTAPDHAIP